MNTSPIKAGCTFVFFPTPIPGEAKQQVTNKVRNAVRIYFNDFKMRIAAPVFPALPPSIVRINFKPSGLMPTELNAIDQFVVFPQWDAATRSLRETWSSPGFVIAERFNAETPFESLELLVTDENNNPIVFEMFALRFTVEYATEPNNRYNNNHAYASASTLPLQWSGQPFSPLTFDSVF
jgi:hypothetical protein